LFKPNKSITSPRRRTDVLDSELENAALRIVSVETVTPGGSREADDVAVCVVRCIEGTARLGMVFERSGAAEVAGAAEPSFALTGIEWYGRQVEQLDTIHSGKVTLAGAGAEKLATHDVLESHAKG
jgi:hypothetical protein